MKKKNLKAIALTLVTALAITAMPVSTVTAEAASKPAQVKNLKKTVVTSNSITVKFKKVKNIKGYQIRVYNTKNKLVKSKTTTKTKYKITGLKASTKYKIKVRAYTVSNKKNVYGKNSKTLTVKTSAATIGKVKNLKDIDSTNKSITLSWSKVKNATGYQVKVYKNSNNKLIKTKKTTKTNITITGLASSTQYTVKVCAYTSINGKTTYGAENDIITATCETDLAETYGVTPPGKSKKSGAALKKEYEAWRNAWIKENITSDMTEKQKMVHFWCEYAILSSCPLQYSSNYTDMYQLYKHGKGNGAAMAQMLLDFCKQMNIDAKLITNPNEYNPEDYCYLNIDTTAQGWCLVKTDDTLCLCQFYKGGASMILETGLPEAKDIKL